MSYNDYIFDPGHVSVNGKSCPDNQQSLIRSQFR